MKSKLFIFLFLELVCIINSIKVENKFLNTNEEILVTNNLDDVYGAGIQQEMVL